MTGWWQAEGDGADSVRDHTATLNGGATFAIGQVGQAFDMNGVAFDAQDVSVPHTVELDPTTAFSWDAWVYWRGDTQNGTQHEAILTKGVDNAGEDSYGMFIFSDGPNSYLFNTFEGQISYTSTLGDVSSNQWIHVAQTYDGVTARAYLNGVEVASISPPSPGTLSTGDLRFGSRWGRSISSMV